jgi:hypothetical protein
MGLENPAVVDAIGLEPATGFVVLAIADTLDWTDEIAHLVALQAKLNAYFAFVETGEINGAYPDAVGRPLRIDILGRHPFPEHRRDFLEQAAIVAARIQVSIRHRLDPPTH